MSETASPEAGWYPDPTNDARWRWWDGAGWTDAVEPRDPEPMPVAAPAPAFAPEPVDAPTPVVPGPASAPAPVAEPVPVDSAPIPTGWVVSDPIAVAAPLQQTWTVASPEAAPAAGSTTTPRAPFTWDTWTPAANAPVFTPDAYREPEEIAKPTTAWVWLVALMPVLYGILAGLLQGGVYVGIQSLALDQSTRVLIGIAALVVAVIPFWVFAELDGRALRRRGFTAPSVLWMLLLPPLAYLLRRGALLKRDDARAPGPLILLVAILVVLIGGAVASVLLLGAVLSTLLSSVDLGL